jgi:hypothetical protein
MDRHASHDLEKLLGKSLRTVFGTRFRTHDNAPSSPHSEIPPPPSHSFEVRHHFDVCTSAMTVNYRRGGLVHVNASDSAVAFRRLLSPPNLPPSRVRNDLKLLGAEFLLPSPPSRVRNDHKL